MTDMLFVALADLAFAEMYQISRAGPLFLN